LWNCVGVVLFFVVISQSAIRNPPYRGRLAPSPTGFLHLGHARTFWIAQQRAKHSGGTLILRSDDLDRDRCKTGFVAAMFEDLKWFGFEWGEGPDLGGPFAPYSQSERTDFYRAALEKLIAGNFVYRCGCSRKDIHAAVSAPHAADDELIYPGLCRPSAESGAGNAEKKTGEPQHTDSALRASHSSFSWRFRVPDGQLISFLDENLGEQRFVAGKDFGDFVVWRHDDVPAYQLACVVDDVAMRISEVVRGADLLVSTARQMLLFRALRQAPPKFFHCQLMRDERGVRLAKRHDALSLRMLRQQGLSPVEIRAGWCGMAY
jgi:glutamyl-tRNA synthetase